MTDLHDPFAAFVRRRLTAYVERSAVGVVVHAAEAEHEMRRGDYASAAAHLRALVAFLVPLTMASAALAALPKGDGE